MQAHCLKQRYGSIFVHIEQFAAAQIIETVSALVCAVNLLHIVYDNAVLHRTQVKYCHYGFAVLSEKLAEHREASILSTSTLAGAFSYDDRIIQHFGNTLYF